MSHTPMPTTVLVFDDQASVREVERLWDGDAFLDKPFTAAGLCEAVALL